MIREFGAESDRALPCQKAFETRAEAPRGIARAARMATEGGDADASRVSPARRPGRHPLSDPCARRAPGIEGQAGLMYIEYVTANANKVLHQLREVGTMASAVKRLEATGFTRTGRMGDLEWSDGRTDARIRFGSPDDAGAPTARHIHEYSLLN